MKNIINKQTAKEHTIEAYHFKVLGGAKNVYDAEGNIDTKQDLSTVEEKSIVEEVKKEPVVQIDEQQNRFIEELLKKSDELSSNIIKLQMQIEKQEADFSNRLKDELKRESESAFEKGYEKAKKELEAQTQEVKNKFLNSINILELEVKKSNDFLKQVESDLSSTALEIAKEVILKEVKDSSSDIALALSKKLIEDLKDAKKMKLKVNSKDYKSLKEAYSDIKNIVVEPDDAIAEGGVVVLSDAGNLDGNIKTRLEKVRNLVHNE